MKHEFKEGQWFDIRKLTDWQKQWCLDNLNFTKWAINLFKEGDVPLYRYKGESFMSTSIGHLHIKNEITFNDLYWSENKEASHESVFDKPKWVTANHNLELSQGLELINGKDYKVISIDKLEEGDLLYKVVNSLGAERKYNEEYFHKVTPEDLLHVAEVVSKDEDFDNLVYVEPVPINNNSYYTLARSQMSQEQWNFVIGNVPMKKGSRGRCEYLNLNPYHRIWFDQDTLTESQDIYITFNNIFKEVN